MAFSKVFIADMQLLFASMAFGFGFAGQKEGMVEGVGPLTFNALRYMISTVILAATALIQSYMTNKGKAVPIYAKDDEYGGYEVDSPLTNPPISSKVIHKTAAAASISPEQKEFHDMINVWFYGFALAFLNFSGSTLQQIGIQYTSSSESAFLTGFYIVFTPLLQVVVPSISAGAKPKWNTWLAVSLAMLGLFIISESQFARGGDSEGSMTLGYGEILTLIGAFFWTFHILLTDYATDRVDGLQLTLVQLLGTSVLSFLASYNLEFTEWNAVHVLRSWKTILFMGSIECAGFTLGALGQTNAPPHRKLCTVVFMYLHFSSLLLPSLLLSAGIIMLLLVSIFIAA
jgi:drug/metabolite transporter (DMT)-like permease